MPSRLPRILLILTGGAVAVCLGGGERLAHRQTIQRLPRDGGALEQFTKEWSAELARLESLYTSHLNGVATAPGDLIGRTREARKVTGLRLLSILGTAEDPSRDYHARIAPTRPANEDCPEPAFSMERVLPGRPYRLVDPTLAKAPQGSSGWIDEPGQPLLYWHRTAVQRTTLFTLDRSEIAERIDSTLKEWLEVHFPTFQSASQGQTELIRGPGGLLAGREPTDRSLPPDLILPHPGRFGLWQLVAWDQRRVREHYDQAWLVGTVLLAGLTLGSGLFISHRVRQALRIAEQRVSFVNCVSHELRTPLTNILLNTDLAAEAASGPVRKRLALIAEETRRLDRLIGNILTFARRDKGQELIETSPVNVRPLAERALETAAASLKRAGITARLSIPADLWLKGNADAVTQILGNLISNVEKYAASGGRLEIRAGEEAGWVVIEVADGGPGIAMEHSARIFRPFERLDVSTSAGGSGLGLGLAIARDLAERQGGSLKLRTPEGSGGGATLTLRLPEAEPAIEMIPFPASRAS